MFFVLLRVCFCSLSVCVCVSFLLLLLFSVFCSACFCFSLENDATHAKHGQACFFVLHPLLDFLRKTRNFLEKLNIGRFCTGKRVVFCKKHDNLCIFPENLCLSQESYTAHAEQKQRHDLVCFLFCSACAPRPLAHSLTRLPLALWRKWQF